jgi:MFS family permease
MESSFRPAAHNGVWVSAILFVYVEQNLHATEEWWGYINGSFSAGMIVGGLLAYRFSERIGARLPGTIFLGTLLCGVLTLVFGFVQAPLLALVIALIRGIPEQLRDVAETLVFQKSASDKLLAKIYAAHGVLFYIVYGVSVLLCLSLTPPTKSSLPGRIRIGTLPPLST